MRKIQVIIVLCLILAGCATPRQMTLFSSKSSSFKLQLPPDFVIAPGDELRITFYAVNSEAVSIYSSAGTDFMVNSNGLVSLPVIGQVKLEGKTIEEAQDYLSDLVKTQVKKPIVRIAIINADVSILGEVVTPKRFLIKDPIALPQAIGVVGGFTKNANLKNVLVQRTEKGKITQYHLNLLSDDIFTSPCYYLQKGDVVNIRPLYAK